MRLEVATPPAVEPVTLAEQKKFLHLYADLDDQDALVQAHVSAAREYVERATARAFITQTLREHRSIPGNGRLRLLRAPVQEVTSVVVDGVEKAGPWPIEGAATIDVGPGSKAVVTYRAGYGDGPASVPFAAGMCIRMLAAYWFERREPVQTGTIVAELPFAMNALMWSLSWGGEVPPP